MRGRDRVVSEFTSPTVGKLTFEEMFADLTAYMNEEPEAEYKIIIGTDSQARDDTVFVTAVIVHRVGKGARYYYQKQRRRKIESLRQKILFEASLSLNLAARLADRLTWNGKVEPNVEIHLDVGTGGETRDLIREVVGMVTGSGFDAKIKPESYGASKVADKHTK